MCAPVCCTLNGLLALLQGGQPRRILLLQCLQLLQLVWQRLGETTFLLECHEFKGIAQKHRLLLLHSTSSWSGNAYMTLKLRHLFAFWLEAPTATYCFPRASSSCYWSGSAWVTEHISQKGIYLKEKAKSPAAAHTAAGLPAPPADLAAHA